jgi:cupin 2 domain-containing protein
MPNLFAEIPANLPDELVETLLGGTAFRVERIVSSGHVSSPGFWYDQERPEWVVVLRGRASLRFEGEEPLMMGPGDFLNIPAHRRHRVEWTTPDEPTVWLAVHYDRTNLEQP